MAPKFFHHPFQPYDIQQDFMEKLYECIERGGVGIFESPTGTGKSLSLICGSLTWLREHKRKAFDEALMSVQIEDDEPAWMLDQARDMRREELRRARDELEAQLRAVRERDEQRQRGQSNGKRGSKKRKLEQSQDGDENEYLLDEFDSGDELSSSAPVRSHDKETESLMQQLGIGPLRATQKKSDETVDELKIFFCSRTHSQLSQFVGELRRVRLPSVLPAESKTSEVAEALKQLSLGSRKNLCINASVARLGDQTAVNERCIELQQSKTPADKKCPFLPKQDEIELVENFRAHALSKLQDIEDLARLGSSLEVCPYYASRSAVGLAEMITLPYPLLLQKSSRDALGLSLKGHVVIIDEAHNLLDAIEGIHSTQISDRQLQLAKDALIVYLQSFRNRLKGANRVYLAQVVRVLDSLLSYTNGLRNAGKTGGVVHPSELLRGKGVDQINIAKLINYISQSRLARKVEGYATFLSAQQVDAARTPKQSEQTLRTPNLTLVQNFLGTLINPSSEGQFFWEKDGGSFELRYMLLDPSEHFRSVVEDARAVILAGGTMSPMEDYQQQLFPYLNHLATFSCGHLIPATSLLVQTIVSDEAGPLRFDFKARSDPNTSVRIGNAIYELASEVKGGMVVFVPSYGFLESIVSALGKHSGKLLQDIQARKPTFFDSRKNTSDSRNAGPTEDTFKAYSAAVSSNPARGAILFSVMGGKLSEGINFSDDLGRCVLVVGLPFPNLETPEWRAKIKYIDTKAQRRGAKANTASQSHVENVCMRAVNQAIGRVIRHKDDWASILLMDTRYSEPRMFNKLPGWIREGTRDAKKPSSTTVEEATGEVSRFFARTKT